MKIQIQKQADKLADLCLAEIKHNRYTDGDLMNATIIFSHILMDRIYTENQHLPIDKMADMAITTGKAIRELIKVTTGKDMHIIAKNL